MTEYALYNLMSWWWLEWFSAQLRLGLHSSCIKTGHHGIVCLIFLWESYCVVPVLCWNMFDKSLRELFTNIYSALLRNISGIKRGAANVIHYQGCHGEYLELWRLGGIANINPLWPGVLDPGNYTGVGWGLGVLRTHSYILGFFMPPSINVQPHIE